MVVENIYYSIYNVITEEEKKAPILQYLQAFPS